MEIQTRQTPVATTPAIPSRMPIPGSRACVSIYTAVAARVGTHRVSYQPNISGVPDPSGLQLRVDGVLTALGPEGIDLRPRPVAPSPSPRGGGRIVKSSAGGGIEIHYADGTKLVVTPAWWDDSAEVVPQRERLRDNGHRGDHGPHRDRAAGCRRSPTARRSDRSRKRCMQRYVRSLREVRRCLARDRCDEPLRLRAGHVDRDIHARDWPRENPTSCAIRGTTVGAARRCGRRRARHCSAVVDKNRKADCVFDVSVTGHPGFAQTYVLTQQLQPGATKTTVKDDKDPTRFGESVTFTATVAPTPSRGGGAPAGTVQFILDGGKVGDPVTLDSSGRALWSTSSLPAGKHQVVAKYVPSGFGGLFLASSSPEESHTVIAAHDLYIWLVILLIIILIVLIIWRYLRTT